MMMVPFSVMVSKKQKFCPLLGLVGVKVFPVFFPLDSKKGKTFLGLFKIFAYSDKTADFAHSKGIVISS